VETSGGKQKINCTNTEGIFRIIQSIPSPKAEPFKCWLTKVGYERVQEIEDPELATARTRELYRAKGCLGGRGLKRSPREAPCFRFCVPVPQKAGGETPPLRGLSVITGGLACRSITKPCG